MEYKRLTKGRQKYSNSYIFYNNIYMRNVTNKERLFISLIIGLSYVIFPIIFFSTEIFKVEYTDSVIPIKLSSVCFAR